MSAAARKKNKLAPLPGLAPRPTRRRPERVADEIRQEVATLLLAKVKDPRVEQVTILKATVTADLRQARIYYSVLHDEAAADAAAGLESARSFIRRSLAKNLVLRVVPALIFERDRSLADQQHLEQLLAEIQ